MKRKKYQYQFTVRRISIVYKVQTQQSVFQIFKIDLGSNSSTISYTNIKNYLFFIDKTNIKRRTSIVAEHIDCLFISTVTPPSRSLELIFFSFEPLRDIRKCRNCKSKAKQSNVNRYIHAVHFSKHKLNNHQAFRYK